MGTILRLPGHNRADAYSSAERLAIHAARVAAKEHGSPRVSLACTEGIQLLQDAIGELRRAHVSSTCYEAVERSLFASQEVKTG